MPTLNVNVKQLPDGSYTATIAEFPQIEVTGSGTLEELRVGFEHMISQIPNPDGSPRGEVRLPPFVLGETTTLDDDQ